MKTPLHDPAFAAPTVEELRPLFPSYALEVFVAQGGMGAVYKARQTSLDRPVAIKILPRQFGADPQFRKSFEAEAKAMARLNHPNLVAVYDFGDLEGMLFIVMEFVEGASLFDSAHRKAIEQTEVARLVAGICHGLAHAHQHGILHRDIKPANILLTSAAKPKIGDFGLARPVGDHAGEEAVFGTPGYSAPEVFKHPGRVDHRADIYSVGVVLYELLTGRLPGDTWRPPSSRAGSDPAFDAIARRAMHPSPEMRYADADEIADDLEEVAGRIRGPLRRKPGPGAALTVSKRPLAATGTSGASGAGRVRPVAATTSQPGVPAWAIVALLLGIGGMAGIIAIQTRDGEDPPAPPARSETIKPRPVIPTETTRRERPRREPVRPEPGWERTPPRERLDRQVARNDPPPKSEDPESPPEPAPEPEPEPAPDPAERTPAFDTAAFLDKGRSALIEDGRPILAEHAGEMERIIERFERRLERVARRLDRQFRDRAEITVEEIVAKCRQNGRVPPTPPKDMPNFLSRFGPDLREAYEETIEDQENADAELASRLEPLQDDYLTGIARQLETLHKQDDPAAVEVLETEAARTRDSLPRFIRILRGEDPDPVDPEAAAGEDDGKNGKKKD